MTDDRLATEFETNRARLESVAYRMLGSRADAEDAVQEAWLRLQRADASAVDNLGAWLTTVTARVCLDRLRARRARPEQFVDELPHADARDDDGDGDPAQHVLLAESIGSALLVVLDALGPAERVAFVLHDVFGVPFDEIGEVLGRSPEASRQLASRARRRVRGTPATASVDLVQQREIVAAFLRAAREGDFEALLGVLDPDVVLQPDAAAQRLGTLRPMRGAAELVGTFSGGARAAHLAVIDGVAGLVWAPGGSMRGVAEFVVADGRIVAINVTGDPERIAQLDVVPVDA